MNITVKIETVDKTDLIVWESFKITDNINEKVDTCTFQIKKHAGQTYVPAIQDEIEVTDGANIIFAGVITKISRSMEGALIEVYEVQCSDWSYNMDKLLVTESYTNKTVAYIIDDILGIYASGFTDNNVDCDIVLSSMVFNNITVSQCLKRLAEAVNYFWYVDYEKDIHFFSKAKELTSFNLTDTNGNYIPKSLVLTDDITQLRTRVKIQGGEVEGSTRHEFFNGDGTKLYFRLGNKFSSLPTVTVGGVPKTVGVDFVSVEDDFDCFWDYNQKYIRFKATTVPASGTDNVDVSGTPLIPIILQVDDASAQSVYGIKEYSVKDVDIASVDEAKQRAMAELEAYAVALSEGSFETQEDGLKSGQTINIQSTIRGISGNYLLQSVSLRMIAYNEGKYTVKIASMRTLGIIYFLQTLLLNGKIVVEEANEVLYKYYTDFQGVKVTEEIAIEVAKEDFTDVQVTEQIRKDPFTVEFVLANYVPTSDSDPKREMKLDISSYLY